LPNDLRRPERTYTIRQLCIEFKVTPRALRFYEDKGLLSPGRDGMNRVYTPRDRVRLALILRGKRVGLALAEIREILDLYSVEDGGAAQVAKTLRKFRERIIALEAQREDIDQALAELRDACSYLETKLASERPDLLGEATAAAASTARPVGRGRLDGLHAATAK
jgi:DNA-binding transcriptional MerR regulator